MGQNEDVEISRCTETHVTISEIDIITSPLPQDEEGKTVSQIKAGFTTLYVSRKPSAVNLEMNQEINKLFNGAKHPLEPSVKTDKIVPVGLEVKCVSFVILRNRSYYLLNTYPELSYEKIMIIELSKIVERDDVNIFTLKVPFVRKAFRDPELSKILLNAGESIK